MAEREAELSSGGGPRTAAPEVPDAGTARTPDDPDRLATFAAVADAVAATRSRLAKVALVADHLTRTSADALPIAARFYAGIVFPRHDARTTGVGSSTIHTVLRALSGLDRDALRERYIALGDSGELAAELLADRSARTLTILEAADAFGTLARTTGSHARRDLVQALLERSGGRAAGYLVKLLGGELRIGLKEAQVEEAIARAWDRPLAAVRHANLLRGDIGEVAALARDDRLNEATLALFHPIGFMLAQPLETPDEIAATLPAPFAVEQKYDGIRAQAHIGAGRVALFSRTLDEITHGYPDVAAVLAGFPEGLVLDGELLAVDADTGRPLPFATLQRRLGRKAPDDALRAEVPVAFVAYDMLAADGTLIVAESYHERRARLEALPWPAGGVASGTALAPVRYLTTSDEVDAAFLDARAMGNEGLLCKDPAAAYAPGRRGKQWIKLKRALATLDVVVVGAERGHGRRRDVLSDYTFAVRASDDDPTLLNVGKAYNGLTDVEILALTARLHELTIQRFGRFHQVQPEIVLEVTFDAVQRSARHKSGFALRFPRIVRIRDDKPPHEIDTLARVRELAGDATGERNGEHDGDGAANSGQVSTGGPGANESATDASGGQA